jgi:hypothetical protein
MNLNRVKDIQKIPIERFVFSKSEDQNDEFSPKEIAAFDIDNMIPDGRLGLLYIDSYNKPKIWFQDLSCCWYFIANSFTDYFRLMFMHLGIPHWHYVFTDVGMDPVSLQWCRYLCPERLTLDINCRNNKPVKESSPKKKKKRIKVIILRRESAYTKEGPRTKKEKVQKTLKSLVAQANTERSQVMIKALIKCERFSIFTIIFLIRCLNFHTLIYSYVIIIILWEKPKDSGLQESSYQDKKSKGGWKRIIGESTQTEHGIMMPSSEHHTLQELWWAGEP